MFSEILDILKTFDSDLTGLIRKFLIPYINERGVNILFFSSRLDVFIKTIIYSLFALTFFLLFKIIFPEKRFVSIILIAIVIIAGLSVAGVFFGFFQLLYNF